MKDGERRGSEDDRGKGVRGEREREKKERGGAGGKDSGTRVKLGYVGICAEGRGREKTLVGVEKVTA